MRAVELKDVKKFEVGDIPEPVSKNGEVLIEIIKTGICGSDIHYWDMGSPKGLVMGHEFCGKVIDPGSRSDLKVGDRVTALPLSPCGKCPACLTGNIQYCPDTWNHATGLSLTNPGGLTEKIAVRADMVLKVPDSVSSEEAAMVEPLAVGLHAVHLANIKVGSKVLVIGGGIIGLVCAMFSKIEGATYVALSETNNARGEKSTKLKVADEWFDAKSENIIDTLNKKSDGGFDVVLDCSGVSAAVNTALAAVKPGGTIVLVGVSMKPIEFQSILAVMRELSIKGAIAYTYDEFKTCLNLMASKQINVLKLLDDVVPFEDVQASYERLTSGKDSAVKILVDPKL